MTTLQELFTCQDDYTMSRYGLTILDQFPFTQDKTICVRGSEARSGELLFTKPGGLLHVKNVLFSKWQWDLARWLNVNEAEMQSVTLNNFEITVDPYGRISDASLEYLESYIKEHYQRVASCV